MTGCTGKRDGIRLGPPSTWMTPPTFSSRSAFGPALTKDDDDPGPDCAERNCHEHEPGQVRTLDDRHHSPARTGFPTVYGQRGNSGSGGRWRTEGFDFDAGNKGGEDVGTLVGCGA